jgi:hypothetical protein
MLSYPVPSITPTRRIVTVTETPAEKKAQNWCFDGSSWRLIDKPMTKDETKLLLRLGGLDDSGYQMSMWRVYNHTKPECMIAVENGATGAYATMYADRLPDGIDLFARWAPAIYAHGGEPKPST